MSYTHYWKLKPQYLKEEQVNAIIKGVNKIIANNPTIKIVGEFGKKNTKPRINKNHILLNGCEDQGYEGFYIDLQKEKQGISFCKTAHQDYDVIICQILILLGEIIADDTIFYLDSDGLSDKYANSLSRNDNIAIDDIVNGNVVNDYSTNNENFMLISWMGAILEYQYHVDDY